MWGRSPARLRQAAPASVSITARVARSRASLPRRATRLPRRRTHPKRSPTARRFGRSPIDLQYWIWYPYNDYSSTFPPGDVWQVHEGDWESVSVILDLSGRPIVVGLSKHCEGTRRSWSQVRRQGVRPVVYVGLGSHANYFGQGAFRRSPVCWPRELRDVVRALEARRSHRPRPDGASQARPRRGEPSLVDALRGDVGRERLRPLRRTTTRSRVSGRLPRAPPFQDTWRAPVRKSSAGRAVTATPARKSSRYSASSFRPPGDLRHDDQLGVLEFVVPDGAPGLSARRAPPRRVRAPRRRRPA